MDLQSLQGTLQLAQTRPAGTAAVSAIAKSKKRKLLLTTIVVANTTGSSANYSIYLDADGTTYDQTTALFYSVALSGNNTDVIEFLNGMPFDPTGAGNLAIQASVGSALTFTVSGVEV